MTDKHSSQTTSNPSEQSKAQADHVERRPDGIDPTDLNSLFPEVFLKLNFLGDNVFDRSHDYLDAA